VCFVCPYCDQKLTFLLPLLLSTHYLQETKRSIRVANVPNC
jgi:hypothetical protein